MFPIIFGQILLIHVSIFLEYVVSNSVDVNCGLQGTFNKLLGGKNTEIDEFPWLARLEYFDGKNESAGFACSGTLIDRQVVLTAAHCITYMQSQNFFLYSVRLGEYNTTTEIDCIDILGSLDCAEPHQDIKVANWTIHPQYYNGYSDIALIFLESSVNYTEFIRPICLPKADQRVDIGTRLTIAGWGLTEHGINSTVKLKIHIPVVSFKDCYQQYMEHNILLNKHRHLCAGGVTGHDSCNGDSGAPLMRTHGGDGIWEIIGITSIGKGCGNKEWPGIYTRVAYYVSWIENEINRTVTQKVENLSLK